MIKKIKNLYGFINYQLINKTKKHIKNVLGNSEIKSYKSNEYILTQVVNDYQYIFKIFAFTQSLSELKK